MTMVLYDRFLLKFPNSVCLYFNYIYTKDCFMSLLLFRLCNFFVSNYFEQNTHIWISEIGQRIFLSKSTDALTTSSYICKNTKISLRHGPDKCGEF